MPLVAAPAAGAFEPFDAALENGGGGLYFANTSGATWVTTSPEGEPFAGRLVEAVACSVANLDWLE